MQIASKGHATSNRSASMHDHQHGLDWLGDDKGRSLPASPGG